ncbi:N-acetylmuramoyl-L-alanine amidase [Profundibacter sp.]|uniref:N-acetylmuramoyl-L-alanine amidase n=1 Tax=Profundibacter sp. TaxID=3101071 RepID=UPI003D1215A1
MSGITRLLMMVFVLWAGAAQAQQMSALARLDATRSYIRDAGRSGLAIDLHLTQAVPYRVFTLDEPRRLVVDFREVDWGGVKAADLLQGSQASGARIGVFRLGWSRMVVDLAAPLVVKTATMVTDPNDGDAMVQIRLVSSDASDFAARAGAPQTPLWGVPQSAGVTRPVARQTGGALVVVLDPGHGGIDPGAQTGGETEANLMLSFARQIKEDLTRAGGFRVVLTRNEDIFVPLETRISIARKAGADVFISLHADTLSEGGAAGATVYTLSETATDEASAILAERHDRDDLLAGVDLAGQDDVIAGVLMDMARVETTARADKLADQLVIGLTAAIGKMHKRPRQSAGFSVLKAADIPSVLIEIGFLSNSGDLKNLTTPQWRAKAAKGIRAGLIEWSAADAVEAGLRRQ